MSITKIAERSINNFIDYRDRKYLECIDLIIDYQRLDNSSQRSKDIISRARLELALNDIIFA